MWRVMLALISLACEAYQPTVRPAAAPASLAVFRTPLVLPRTSTITASSPLLSLLRRPLDLIRRKPKTIECGKNKYGCDPRTQSDPKVVSEAAAAIRDTLSWPTLKPGQVNELTGGTAQLEQVLSAASERTVVLKFKREGCPACGSTVAPLASAAQAFLGRVDFFEVDYKRSKAFCYKCAIKTVPCAHIYVNGTLSETLPLGPSVWSEFATRLEEIAGAPDGEVLEPTVKPKAQQNGFEMFDR